MGNNTINTCLNLKLKATNQHVSELTPIELALLLHSENSKDLFPCNYTNDRTSVL